MSAVEHHLQLWLWLGGLAALGFAFALASALSARAPAPRSREQWRLQLAVGGVASSVAFWLFLVGFRGYVNAAVAPGDAVEITATAERWHWTFTYAADGKTADDVLRVPVNRPIHVTVHSNDLVHRLDVPSLHAAAEATPDADGSTWFVAPRAGEAPLFCGAACNGHPEMVSRVSALDAAAWDDWRDESAHLTPAQYGEKLYAKSLCKTCHSLDGTPGTAPSFKGVFGKHETLADGSTVLVDEAYIKESILSPTAKVVKGFQPVMPPFAGQLDDKQLDALVAFIKTVKP